MSNNVLCETCKRIDKNRIYECNGFIKYGCKRLSLVMTKDDYYRDGKLHECDSDEWCYDKMENIEL